MNVAMSKDQLPSSLILETAKNEREGAASHKKSKPSEATLALGVVVTSTNDTSASPKLPMVRKNGSQPESKKSGSHRLAKRQNSTLQDLVTRISSLKSLITEIASPTTSLAPERSIFDNQNTSEKILAISPKATEDILTAEVHHAVDSKRKTTRSPKEKEDKATSTFQTSFFGLARPLMDQEPGQVAFRKNLQLNRSGSNIRAPGDKAKSTARERAAVGKSELSSPSNTPGLLLDNDLSVSCTSVPSEIQPSDQTVAYEPPLPPGSSVRPASSARPHSEISPAALLKELFPGEAERPSGQMHEENDADITVPRLPLPTDELPASSLNRPTIVASEEAMRKNLRHSMTNKDVMTVLELQSGNISLTADDFRRLTPKGKHMKEWAVQGEFKTVFPRRNPWTLARDPPGHYFIVFSTTASAHAYLEHLVHVQKLARQYTPTSLASPIPPPPGYLINGEDVHALIKDFTLICPAQTLNVATYSIGPGFTKFKAQLFERGGYPEIVGEGRAKVPQVLLTMVAGPQPTYYELGDAIGKSGRDRNRAWQLVEHPDRIRMIEMDRYARSHLNGKDDGGDYRERVAKLKKPDYGQRWILTFLDVEEAKSFVRCWHQRPLPWMRRKAEEEEYSRYGKQVTMVEAELLW
jgi:hypothetical protein